MTHTFANVLRAAVVMGSFSVVAMGCAVGAGTAADASTGSTSEAIKYCPPGAPLCTPFPVLPPVTKAPAAPVCNALTECCVDGGSTLANIDVQASIGFTTSQTCGKDLAALGCGGLDPVWTDATYGEFETGYTTALIPQVAIDSAGHTWYQVFCPAGALTSFEDTSGDVLYVPPASCGTGAYLRAPPTTATLCEHSVPAGMTQFVIDPIGCTGAQCTISRPTWIVGSI